MENIEYPIGSRVQHRIVQSALGTIVTIEDILQHTKYPAMPPDILDYVKTRELKKIILVDEDKWPSTGYWCNEHCPYYYCGPYTIEDLWNLVSKINKVNSNICPKCGSSKTNYISLAMKCEDCWLTW